MKKLITHNGSFHSDDIFASAALSIFFEKKGEDFEIIRTRDPEIIESGDIVFDVGGIYDAEKNRFDHHQKGGAGFRDNTIEYASFGLVWKNFGKELVNNNERIWNIVDERLACPVDAFDNGFSLIENKHSVSPYLVQDVFLSMRPTWQEETSEEETLKMFLRSVEIATVILEREIKHAEAFVLAEEKVIEIYNNTKDKRIIILDDSYPYEYSLNGFSEPMYVISQRKPDGLWGVKAIKQDLKTFKNRKDFPASWGGLGDQDLQNITGVSDAVFCHKGLFLAVAKSKEGAQKLAEIALGK